MTRADTVAAVATAPGRGGIAVVRVSGPDARTVCARLTGSDRFPSVRADVRFARLRAPSDPAGRILDEGLVLSFPKPHSYTGEDVVEFHCHGGSVTPRRVLAACLEAGARLARRGEFTERAFLNGRLDYAQAESVLDLIDAKTDRAADAALEGLAGGRRQELRDLYDRLLALSSEVEHALDVDEGELPEGFQSGMCARVGAVRAAVDDALRRARAGRILRDGALVVLAGPPNAGKSSLMNALLGESRAIVAATPGTTRDIVEAWLDVGGWPVRLADTAGIRHAADGASLDAVEAEGVRRAEALIASADVVLRLDEAAAGPRELLVHAKCDLGRGPGLNVSSRTGEGLDVLRATLAQRLEAHAAEMSEAPSADDRHAAVLQEVRHALAPLDDAAFWLEPVLVGNALRTSAEALGEALGAVYADDLLDRLFSRFCVGK